MIPKNSDNSDIVDRVKSFVSLHLGIRKEHLSPDRRLLEDLGIDGDDAMDFLNSFCEEFSLDCSAFRFDRHFGPDAAPILANLLWGHVVGLQFKTVPISMADLIEAVRCGRLA